jgi:hypothetical protein
MLLYRDMKIYLFRYKNIHSCLKRSYKIHKRCSANINEFLNKKNISYVDGERRRLRTQNHQRPLMKVTWWRELFGWKGWGGAGFSRQTMKHDIFSFLFVVSLVTDGGGCDSLCFQQMGSVCYLLVVFWCLSCSRWWLDVLGFHLILVAAVARAVKWAGPEGKDI